MGEKYLVINAGSSSLKFSLYEMPEEKEIVNGLIEKIGFSDSSYDLKYNGIKEEYSEEVKNHDDAVELMLNVLIQKEFIDNVDEIKGVGHRILHGGEFYNDSVVITDGVMENIKKLVKFGPLHLPGQISGISSIKNVLPQVPQVAVFDTAFHHTIPEYNYMYAVPYDWYEKYGVRKYGFHGISYKYIVGQLQQYYGKVDINAIICHIGSGASVCAIKDGKSYNTSMGLSPLDGLVMGTRSGSIDASIIEYICKETGYSVEEITSILNKQSGMLGISSKNDFRDVYALKDNGNKLGSLAIELAKKSIVKYIAQYYFELDGNIDALVFTAGAGENQIILREEIVNSISKPMNVTLNKDANDEIARFKKYQSGKISTENCLGCDVFVIPTDEEKMILEDTVALTNTNKILKEKRKCKK